ncbi:MAG: serine/threonine protein kinase [Opitutus sp.]|nr:serine/threonine protein kinase [Opitutus sp.]
MKSSSPAVLSHPRSALLLLFAFAQTIVAADWPTWRGPRGDGSCDETDIPLRWSKTENIAWTAPIPGKGHSSPIVFGDRVFVTTCLEPEEKHVLLCLDRLTGRLLWEKSSPAKLQERIHKLNSHASSTPATDGKMVWVSFLDDSDMTIVAYDVRDGTQLWKTIPGKMLSRHGYCSTVLPFKDMIIINGDQDAVGYIVALDGATGRERWRTERPNRTRSYCAPIIIEVKGRKQLVLSGSLCVAAYDPDTGKLIWIIDGPTEQFVSSPIYLDDVVFMTYGFPKRGICAIDPVGMGNVTQTHLMYNLEQQSRGGYVPSPVAHGKLAFVVNDEGIGTCADPRTGREIWLERLGRHHSASPVIAGGNVYFLDDNGKCWIVKAQDRYELVVVNDLGEETRGSPAISRGQIFIRGGKMLYCIGKK